MNSKRATAETALVLWVGFCVLLLSTTILLIWSFAATAISAATHSEPIHFFLATTNYVLDLLRIDRSRISPDAYLGALNQIGNALSIIFAVVVTALPLGVFAAKLFTRPTERDRSPLREQKTPTKKEEYAILEQYYRGAERIVVYAGDFSWLSEDSILRQHVGRLAPAGRIQLVSSKTQEQVKCAIGVKLYGDLFRHFKFNFEKDIRCSLITYPGGGRAFLYRYNNQEDGSFYICSVREFSSSSYLL
jgi:hypothetical protein